MNLFNRKPDLEHLTEDISTPNTEASQDYAKDTDGFWKYQLKRQGADLSGMITAIYPLVLMNETLLAKMTHYQSMLSRGKNLMLSATLLCALFPARDYIVDKFELTGNCRKAFDSIFGFSVGTFVNYAIYDSVGVEDPIKLAIGIGGALLVGSFVGMSVDVSREIYNVKRHPDNDLCNRLSKYPKGIKKRIGAYALAGSIALQSTLYNIFPDSADTILQQPQLPLSQHVDFQ